MENKQKGLLVVISGFSGSGKGTLMKALLSDYEGYSLSISATTREPRTGEEDGREYFFVSRGTFLKMIEDGELLEYARYLDNYYGTPRKYVESELEKGRDVILEIETEGALQIKAVFPEAVLIFVTPPSADELEKRLKKRGTESDGTIRKRLRKAVTESEGIENYDYILINDDLKKAVHDLDSLIKTQRMRVGNRSDFINGIREELKAGYGFL